MQINPSSDRACRKQRKPNINNPTDQAAMRLAYWKAKPSCWSAHAPVAHASLLVPRKHLRLLHLLSDGPIFSRAWHLIQFCPGWMELNLQHCCRTLRALLDIYTVDQDKDEDLQTISKQIMGSCWPLAVVAHALGIIWLSISLHLAASMLWRHLYISSHELSRQEPDICVTDQGCTSSLVCSPSQFQRMNISRSQDCADRWSVSSMQMLWNFV